MAQVTFCLQLLFNVMIFNQSDTISAKCSEIQNKIFHLLTDKTRIREIQLTVRHIIR